MDLITKYFNKKKEYYIKKYLLYKNKYLDLKGGSILYLNKNISFCIYINLDHRTDRKEHIENLLNKTDLDKSKILRFSAIKKSPGWKGCLDSHIKCLENCLEKKISGNILILEDDFTFIEDISLVNKMLDIFFNEFKEFDVLHLSPRWAKKNDTNNNYIKKVNWTNDSGGYIINYSYIEKLLNNFKNCQNEYDNVKGYSHNLRLDNCWNKIIPINNWYCISPPIGKQISSYSDIWQSYVAPSIHEY